MNKKQLKPKKCQFKKCRDIFTPRNGFQRTCFNAECAYGLVQQKKEEAKRKKTAKLKRELLENDRSHWTKKAQAQFNRWIKLRDHGLPCISCPKKDGRFDAGHYRSVGAARHLRFNEDNVHKQCSMFCNKLNSGNAIAYRIGLVKKIGVARVEAIENNNEIVKYTLDDFRDIYFTYKNKSDELEKLIGLK